MKVLATNTSFGQKFIIYLGPVHFNSLPNHVKSYVNNKNKFKYFFVSRIKYIYVTMY